MQHEHRLPLPAPDSASAAHCARVAEYIRQRIVDAGGSISFAEYMQHALYAPGLGYYAAGAVKFGAAGDFVTAPEVSPLFGRVLARQCAEVFAEIKPANVLEFGAGSGRLAADLLRALGELHALPEQYAILEVSADLRQRQEDFLRREIPEYFERCTWVDGLPQTHTGIIIANEVLDALPVERFRRRGESLRQLRVGVQGDAFKYLERPAPAVLADAVAVVEEELGQALPVDYVSEISLGIPGWIAGLAGALRQGVAFLIDYGVSRGEYYATGRSAGWLRCHFRHHVHDDALILPGIQDLTAWVDFSAVASAAVENGLEVAGFVTQSQFLLGGGLDKEFEKFSEMPLDAQLQLSAQVKLLTLPEEMGENFKCLGLSRGMTITPSAFGFADRTQLL